MRIVINPYSEYKDSGVPCLGNIPKHWDTKRLKQVCRLAYGNSLPTDLREEGTVSVYGSNGCIGYHTSSNTESPCIIIGRKGSFGKVNFSCDPVFAIDTTFFIDNRFTSNNLRFMFYLIEWLGLDKVSKDSAVPGLSREDAYSRMTVLPTLDEQKDIVSYLNYIDRRIKRYIRAKQKLIKLLNEQKQVIIHQAVTRGLDPNVRFKPSGMEWLGNIPENWNIVPLKYLCENIQNGATPPTSEQAFYENGTIPWYGPSSCVNYEQVGPPVRFLNKSAFNKGKAKIIHGPAILIVVIGATAGRLALLHEDGSTNQQITSFELMIRLVRPKFIIYQLQNSEKRLRATASTATIPILDSGVVSRIPIALPPLSEQEAINFFLDKKTKNLNKAINRITNEITLLKEFYTRLISDVVTGKLDVRAVAAQLPDEPEELASAEEEEILMEGDNDEEVLEPIDEEEEV